MEVSGMRRWWIILLAAGLAGCCCPQRRICELRAGEAVTPQRHVQMPVIVYGDSGARCGWMCVGPDWQLVPPGVQE